MIHDILCSRVSSGHIAARGPTLHDHRVDPGVVRGGRGAAAVAGGSARTIILPTPALPSRSSAPTHPRSSPPDGHRHVPAPVAVPNGTPHTSSAAFTSGPRTAARRRMCAADRRRFAGEVTIGTSTSPHRLDRRAPPRRVRRALDRAGQPIAAERRDRVEPSGPRAPAEAARRFWFWFWFWFWSPSSSVAKVRTASSGRAPHDPRDRSNAVSSPRGVARG